MAGDQAKRAYLHLQQAFGDAARTGDYRSGALVRYSGDPARAELVAALYVRWRQGIVTVTRGHASSYAPQVSYVRLGVSPSEVGIRDCVDARSVYSVFKASGRSAEPSGSPYQPHRRHPATAVVRQYGGRWLVIRLATDQAATC